MKKSLGLPTLACAAVFSGFSAFATAYYVAMDGVDAEGRGAADAPFASLEFALSKAGIDGLTWLDTTAPDSVSAMRENALTGARSYRLGPYGFAIVNVGL